MHWSSFILCIIKGLKLLWPLNDQKTILWWLPNWGQCFWADFILFFKILNFCYALNWIKKLLVHSKWRSLLSNAFNMEKSTKCHDFSIKILLLKEANDVFTINCFSPFSPNNDCNKLMGLSYEKTFNQPNDCEGLYVLLYCNESPFSNQ